MGGGNRDECHVFHQPNSSSDAALSFSPTKNKSIISPEREPIYNKRYKENLSDTHFSFIQDINKYCSTYRCGKCGDSLWKTLYALHRHERTCESGVRRIYPGGVYRPPPSVFQLLDEENIHVQECLRCYPYRATFD